MDPDSLSDAIERAQNCYFQLVVVTGKSDTLFHEYMATSDGVVAINLGLDLSEKLIKVPRQDRAKASESLFTDILVSERNTHIFLLNHIEILFDKTLSIDPLKLLQKSAKNQTLVVSWPGEKTASSLTYAKLSHPEHRCYNASDFGEIVFIEMDEKN